MTTHTCTFYALLVTQFHYQKFLAFLCKTLLVTIYSTFEYLCKMPLRAEKLLAGSNLCFFHEGLKGWSLSLSDEFVILPIRCYAKWFNINSFITLVSLQILKLHHQKNHCYCVMGINATCKADHDFDNEFVILPIRCYAKWFNINSFITLVSLQILKLHHQKNHCYCVMGINSTCKADHDFDNGACINLLSML